MATTTNYGWTTPDDTALVKDGASAIRTLGSSVDTTVKNLNPETTLGDISYRSSTANTKTRLPIGTDGQLLTVSSGVPAWVTPAASGGMVLLSTTTLSGTSTVISGLASSSYNDYLIVIDSVQNGTNGQLRCATNNTTNIAQIYTATTTTVATSSTGTTIFLSNTDMKNTSSVNGIACRIYNVGQGGRKALSVSGFYENSSSTQVGFMSSGGIQVSGSITSLTFTNSGGGSFSQGTVLVYGVK